MRLLKWLGLFVLVFVFIQLLVGYFLTEKNEILLLLILFIIPGIPAGVIWSLHDGTEDNNI